MNGLHILAEFHDCHCSPALLCGATALATLCGGACKAAGLTVVAEAFHQFADAGATGAVILAESHLAIHTWPELNAATFDLYVCNFSQDNRAAAESVYEALRAALQPADVVRRDVLRGALQPESGMKP